MTAIRVSGLVKRYGSTCALDSVGLTVSEGQVHGLLGPNGAGKTTLLRLLFGLIGPDAGTIELLGYDRQASGVVSFPGVAGFVEEPSFYPYLSGRANLELMAELDGGSARHEVDDALARVGLAGRGADRVSGYSTGMRQRLGIAAALLRSPQVLLLDEPTSGLDPAGSRAVVALVSELAAQGVAVVISSHRIGELETICDGYTVLRDGRVVWSGSATELQAQAPASAHTLVTSDDERALQIAAEAPGVRASRSAGGTLTLSIAGRTTDAFVLSLGDAGIAVRRLELLVSPLESMFFALTSDTDVERLAPDQLAHVVLSRS